jgi:hypothetical protein
MMRPRVTAFLFGVDESVDIQLYGIFTGIWMEVINALSIGLASIAVEVLLDEKRVLAQAGHGHRKKDGVYIFVQQGVERLVGLFQPYLLVIVELAGEPFHHRGQIRFQPAALRWRFGAERRPKDHCRKPNFFHCSSVCFRK